MSTYNTSTTSINTSVAALAGSVRAECSVLLHGMCSTKVAALSAEVAGTEGMTHINVQSTWARIDQVLPNWSIELPSTSVTALMAARAGELTVTQALGTVTQNLAALERVAVADMSANVLDRLGYALQRADGHHTSAIEARRGHETFLVVVGDKGQVTTDHAGMGDDTCTERQREYVEGMRLQGALMDEEFTAQHHDPRGGSPIANAAREGEASLAAGAVISGDAQHGGSLTASLIAPPVVQGRRLHEEDIR